MIVGFGRFGGTILPVAVRCFGPLLTAASTACSNRSQPSVSVSISSGFGFFGGFFAMCNHIAFQDARSLVNRAKTHVDELDAGLDAFTDDNPWATLVEPNAEKTEYTHKLRLAKRINPRLKPIAADAANNLRSALDHVASECARLNGAGNVSNIHFPFRPTAADLDIAIADKRLRSVPPEILTYFRALDPYNGGNDRLYALTQISARNKHWSLTPMFTDAKGIKIFRADGGISFVQTTDWAACPEQDIVLFASAKPNENYEYHVGFVIYFDGIGVASKLPAMPTLRYLAGVVDDVVNDCEAICRNLGLLTA